MWIKSCMTDSLVGPSKLVTAELKIKKPQLSTNKSIEVPAISEHQQGQALPFSVSPVSSRAWGV